MNSLSDSVFAEIISGPSIRNIEKKSRASSVMLAHLSTWGSVILIPSLNEWRTSVVISSSLRSRPMLKILLVLMTMH